jgi:hypothetical protein
MIPDRPIHNRRSGRSAFSYTMKVTQELEPIGLPIVSFGSTEVSGERLGVLLTLSIQEKEAILMPTASLFS